MNSQSSGCTERVTMSRWSWRSLRISACAMARVPAPRRASVPAASPAGRPPSGGVSAEPAGDAALCADIAEPPLLGSGLVAVERPAGDSREDLFEAVGGVVLAQLGGLALRDQHAAIDHADAVALALGLLHQVGRDEDRRPGLGAQGLQAVPHHPARG